MVIELVYTPLSDFAPLAAGLVALSTLAGSYFYLRKQCRFWSEEGKKLSTTSGYVTPYVSRASRLALYAVTRLMAPYYLGGVKVKGGHKLQKKGTRKILLPNHQFEHDAIALSYLLGTRRWRFLAAIDQLGGHRAPWMAWLGVIPVEPRNLRAKVRVMFHVVETLAREPGTGFVIFPQGQLVEDNVLRLEDYNNGAAIIASKAAEKSGDDFSLVPIYVDYVTDPAKANLWQRIFAAIGLTRKFQNRTIYGCTINIGDEIPALPQADKEVLIKQVFDATVALAQVA